MPEYLACTLLVHICLGFCEVMDGWAAFEEKLISINTASNVAFPCRYLLVEIRFEGVVATLLADFKLWNLAPTQSKL